MKKTSDFNSKIQFLLTDIDDTLTDEGLLGKEAYSSLWYLQQKGVKVIPVTGRPAGWCEMIARVWPVSGVVGENGAFYFRYHNRKMLRHFALPESQRKIDRLALDQIQNKILQEVPGSAVASDQFCRLADLAIDFCEDVPKLNATEVKKIVQIFEAAGAQAKVSSIHVNGWFGNYDKLTQSLNFLSKEFSLVGNAVKEVCAFAGDSPNDEPMFQYFPHSFAVSNISEFLAALKHKPQYIAQHRGGKGFAEIVNQILLFA